MKVDGKAAIVTGSGTGVGRETALGLARLGCSVLINYSRSKDAAEDTAAEVEKLGVKTLAVKADVSVDAECRAMVDAATRHFGRLDVLVNNAGTTKFIPHNELDQVTTEDWERIMAVNAMGPFQCARAASVALIESGSADIVNVSSVAGLRGTGSSIPYCASKAALNSLTLTLARALAPKVRVNAVAPGFITGKWLEQGLGEAYGAIKMHQEQRAVLGKVCDPIDVAEAVISLITGSDLVTGQILPCEGGTGLAV
jgi:3-oxoacyl-[acyl-carrier protein] reductase